MLLTSHRRWDSCGDVVVIHAAGFKSLILRTLLVALVPHMHGVKSPPCVATLEMSENEGREDEGDGDYESLPPHVSLTTHMTAGAVAGVLEHTVMYPVDSVKVGSLETLWGASRVLTDLPTDLIHTHTHTHTHRHTHTDTHGAWLCSWMANVSSFIKSRRRSDSELFMLHGSLDPQTVLGPCGPSPVLGSQDGRSDGLSD